MALIEVVVHKAGMKLMNGESVGDFTRALADALRKSVAPSGANSDVDVWLSETFPNTAVYGVWRQREGTKMYAVPYERDKAGNFKFGQKKEVRRRATFVDTNGKQVKKAAGTSFEDRYVPFWNKD